MWSYCQCLVHTVFMLTVQVIKYGHGTLKVSSFSVTNKSVKIISENIVELEPHFNMFA